ncbi:SERTA domain-containing protein 3 [Marasmius tenuissimus]|uniref:SERTA domain-containing protein 3 n=1 Tax=Marasmius tenuissimus TaxID=585030 RepID=A0ABR2ZU38_9AGAR
MFKRSGEELPFKKVRLMYTRGEVQELEEKLKSCQDRAKQLQEQVQILKERHEQYEIHGMNHHVRGECHLWTLSKSRVDEEHRIRRISELAIKEIKDECEREKDMLMNAESEAKLHYEEMASNYFRDLQATRDELKSAEHIIEEYVCRSGVDLRDQSQWTLPQNAHLPLQDTAETSKGDREPNNPQGSQQNVDTSDGSGTGLANDALKVTGDIAPVRGPVDAHAGVDERDINSNTAVSCSCTQASHNPSIQGPDDPDKSGRSNDIPILSRQRDIVRAVDLECGEPRKADDVQAPQDTNKMRNVTALDPRVKERHEAEAKSSESTQASVERDGQSNTPRAAPYAESQTRKVVDGESQVTEIRQSTLIRQGTSSMSLLAPRETITIRGISITSSLQQPAWLESAVHYLLADADERIVAFVRIWAPAESRAKATANGLAHITGTLARFRNGDVSKRFAGKLDPEIDQAFAESFPSEIQKTWLKLQPSWRGQPVNKRLPPIPENRGAWTSLNKWGKNGWVLLLVSLKWWYTSIDKLDTNEQEEGRKDWQLVVEEMKETFKHVADIAA